jgi:glycosyltransferase involved in cell wall biosynthesis
VKPLKVAILTTDKRDHERDYANPVPGFGAAPEALLQGFALLPEVEVHVVSCVHRPVVSPEKIAPNIFYHSLVVPKLGWMRTLYAGCIRATRRKLREIQPDIVHGQGTELDCGISAARSGFPNVLTIHGNMKAIAQIYGAKLGSFHWLAEKLETAALRRTAGVFCNSVYTESLVATRAKKTWRVPNALRQDFFTPAYKQKKSTVPVLLNIGVVEPRKQQVKILESAQRLHDRGLNFEIWFVGDRAAHTEYGKAFSRELDKAEKGGYARHLGLLSTGRLIQTMDSADALVHFPTEEAFGLVAAEALARNLKFFGAKTGGVKEITEGVEGAELFPADDFSGLENAIARWLAAGALHPMNAADNMRKRYRPEVIARRHLEIYREVFQLDVDSFLKVS